MNQMGERNYNQWVDDFADGLYRFALKNVRDTDFAKDLVQDAYEKLWIKKDAIDPMKAKSYLFQIVNNAIIDKARKLKVHRDFESQSIASTMTEQQPFDLHSTLESALLQLPEIQRHVVMLRDYEGYSYEEIGEITGLTEHQVKVYIFRARQKLRSFLVHPTLIV